MISHLRSRSTASSVYPGDETPSADDVPELPANARHLHAYGADNPHLQPGRIDLANARSDPWELEDTSNRAPGSVSPLEYPEASTYGSRVPHRTASERNHQGQSQFSQVSAISQESSAGSWQNDLQKSGHNRDASTATQQERDAFDNELAARRAAIQDSIKNIVEIERSHSPSTSSSGPFKALSKLRTKNSRDSVDPKRDAAKPFRTGANSSAHSPVSASYERTGFSFDMARPRGDSSSRPPMPNNASQVRTLHSEQDMRHVDSKKRSPSSSAGGRSRSNSAATTGRSRSRTGPYRDDLDKAMAEGAGSSAAGLPDLTAFVPKELTPRPSPDISASQFEAGRARSTSRGGAPGYFDARQYQPSQTPSRNVSGNTVPQLLSSAVYTPSAASARSSPAPSPFVQQTATPPLSGQNTPLNATFATPATNGTRPLRKKTISKSDISEPTLLSWTSNIDTVDLPAGASLKNGMTEAPPVPPINPKRKTRKMFGRSDRSESMGEQSQRTKTPEPWATFDSMSNSNAESGAQQMAMTRGYDSSPALDKLAMPANNSVNPADRIERSAASQASLNGAMF